MNPSNPTTDPLYCPLRAAQSVFVPIRHLRYHVLTWGHPQPGRAPLVLVHGWMDVAASYQFVVDALEQDRFIVAPDWRGYGLTWDRGAPPVDTYWYPDYLADLDALLDHFSPGEPVNLVGHSMGGNVVTLYAGVRPQRIRRLVNLEGFGMPATQPIQAPARLANWMDDLNKLHRGELALRSYPSQQAVADRLVKTNPRLGRNAEGRAKALWLARHWAAPNAQGEWEILGDAAHKVINPQLYRVEEVQACWRRITAPTLCVQASDDSLDGWWKGRYTLAHYLDRIQAIPRVQTATLADAGHMLHHDQPAALARLIDDFLA